MNLYLLMASSITLVVSILYLTAMFWSTQKKMLQPIYVLLGMRKAEVKVVLKRMKYFISEQAENIEGYTLADEDYEELIKSDSDSSDLSIKEVEVIDMDKLKSLKNTVSQLSQKSRAIVALELNKNIQKQLNKARSLRKGEDPQNLIDKKNERRASIGSLSRASLKSREKKGGSPNNLVKSMRRVAAFNMYPSRMIAQPTKLFGKKSLADSEKNQASEEKKLVKLNSGLGKTVLKVNCPPRGASGKKNKEDPKKSMGQDTDVLDLRESVGSIKTLTAKQKAQIYIEVCLVLAICAILAFDYLSCFQLQDNFVAVKEYLSTVASLKGSMLIINTLVQDSIANSKQPLVLSSQKKIPAEEIQKILGTLENMSLDSADKLARDFAAVYGLHSDFLKKPICSKDPTACSQAPILEKGAWMAILRFVQTSEQMFEVAELDPSSSSPALRFDAFSSTLSELRSFP